jgi:hypothetical protein
MSMEICFRIGDAEHCYAVPVVEMRLSPHLPGIGPKNFPQLLRDATILASLQAANQVSDDGARNALHSGIDAAVRALKIRGGSFVSIVADAVAGGAPSGGGNSNPGHRD